MSGTVGGVGGTGVGYGANATLVANAANIRQQLNTLTEQVSSGNVSQTYAGLNAQASISLSLNPQLSALATYKTNIEQATGTMGVTQAAMTQLQKVAATFSADIPNLNSLNPTEVDSIAANARAALQQVADLLDTKNGDVYVFGGQDSANPPVPAPSQILSSSFYTQVNTAVSSLSANGADATTAATLAIGQSNDPGTSPFSAYMSQPPSAINAQVVQTGATTTVPIGLLASGNSVAISQGTSTTGSYTRDLMRALATIGSMTSSQASDPNFAALVQDTGVSLTGTVSAMATDAGVLGDAQTSLTTTQTNLSSTTIALTSQVSAVQDTDMASALSQLTATQTQLQESYRLITSANSMSLINYLPAA